MNNLYRIFALLFLIIIFSVSCSDKKTEEKEIATDTTKTIKTNTIATNNSSEKIKPDTLVNKKKNIKTYKYICPLGCKQGNSDTDGLCSKCGMELIENPDYITKKTK